MADFPDAAELKRRLRDRVAPERDLGHVEGSGDRRKRMNEN